MVIYRFLHLPRGYWMPLTALLVLKLDFNGHVRAWSGANRWYDLGAGIIVLL